MSRENNGATNRMDFESFKRLSEDERNFFIFDAICTMGKVAQRLEDGNELYAAKWVETALKAVGATTFAAAVTAVFAYFSTHKGV